MHGSLTVRSADLRIRLRDICSKVADVHCREATIAFFIDADTLVYYPSCESSDLIRDSFKDLWSRRTCYFDPYLAVAYPTAIKKVKRFRKQWLLTKNSSIWQGSRAWGTTTHSVRDKRIALFQCVCCPTAEQRCQVCSIPPVTYAIVRGSGDDRQWTSLNWEAGRPIE